MLQVNLSLINKGHKRYYQMYDNLVVQAVCMPYSAKKKAKSKQCK